MDNRRFSRQELFALAGLVVVALLVRLYFLPFYRVISADGVGYVTAARSLLQGNFAPLTVYGVVYPSLTALVSIVGIDTETAGRLVSVVMGSLLLVPVYLLGREFFSRTAGVVACTLIIAWPPLRSWAGEVMTQATYITLLAIWYWLLWQAFRRRSVSWTIAAGIVAGLSYLTRPESLVAFVLMLFVLLLPSAGGGALRRRVALTAVCVGAFALMLLPFLGLVHHVTGLWQLTGKGGATLADALSEYLGRPDLKTEPGFKGIGFLDVVRTYPDFLRMNPAKNLAKTLQTMVPWYLWALAAVGFVAGGWQREPVMARLYLLASFAPLGVIILFFFVGPEYFQPYLPVLFLWIGNGMHVVERFLVRSFQTSEGVCTVVAKVPVAVIAASLLTIIVFVGQVPKDRNRPYHFEDDGGRYDQRRVGELLKKHLPPSSRIMTRWGRISFYAEMDNVTMPQAELAEMVSLARSQKVRFVVVDGMLMGMRPQFWPLFEPLIAGPDTILHVATPGASRFSPVPGLSLYLLYKEPSSVGVAVYEVET